MTSLCTQIDQARQECIDRRQQGAIKLGSLSTSAPTSAATGGSSTAAAEGAPAQGRPLWGLGRSPPSDAAARPAVGAGAATATATSVAVAQGTVRELRSALATKEAAYSMLHCTYLNEVKEKQRKAEALELQTAETRAAVQRAAETDRALSMERAAVEKLSAELSAAQSLLEGERETAARVSACAADIRSQLDGATLQLDKTGAMHAATTQRAEALQTRYGSLLAEHTAVQQQKDAADAQLASFASSLETRTTEAVARQMAEAAAREEELGQRTSALAGELREAKLSRTRLEIEIDTQARRVASAESELLSLRAKLETTASESEALRVDLEQARALAASPSAPPAGVDLLDTDVGSVDKAPLTPSQLLLGESDRRVVRIGAPPPVEGLTLTLSPCPKTSALDSLLLTRGGRQADEHALLPALDGSGPSVSEPARTHVSKSFNDNVVKDMAWTFRRLQTAYGVAA